MGVLVLPSSFSSVLAFVVVLFSSFYFFRSSCYLPFSSRSISSSLFLHAPRARQENSFCVPVFGFSLAANFPSHGYTFG
jgi:hypothetical protein